MGSVLRRRSLSLVLGAWALTGCPGPEPEPEGPCATAPGDPILTLANRGGGPVLADGVDVEIFLPPQGGVFTELDVTIEGLDAEDLDILQIAIDARDTGDSLALVRFVGELLPLRCTEDEVLVVDYVPVGFTDPVTIEALDGVAATLTGTLETVRGDVSVTHDVVLRAVDF